jgi:2-pyrone-4,6-dicarboxylate lactonase
VVEALRFMHRVCSALAHPTAAACIGSGGISLWSQGDLPVRRTLAGPPYDDVVPFGRRLVELFPDRVLRGTDWPHPSMNKIAPGAAEQQALPMDNPMRLYWA